MQRHEETQDVSTCPHGSETQFNTRVQIAGLKKKKTFSTPELSGEVNRARRVKGHLVSSSALQQMFTVEITSELHCSVVTETGWKDGDNYQNKSPSKMYRNVL